MKKWLAVAVFLIFVSNAFAQELPPGGKEYKAGEEAMKKNDFDTAIPAFEKALAANPDLFASHYYLGFAYRAKKGFEKCGDNFLQFLKKLGSKQAGDMKVHATREGGLCLARGKNPTQSIPYLEEAVSAKPNDKQSQFYLGVSLMRSRRDADAERVFSKVIQLDPNLHRAYYYAGRINFNSEQFEQASERLSKFLAAAPNDPFALDSHFMVGMAMVRLADGRANATVQHDSAINHLNQFLQGKPNAPQSAQAHYILGTLAAGREDNDTAQKHYEQYLQRQPSGPLAEEVKKWLESLKESSQ